MNRWNPADLPLRCRARAACRAFWACLRGDYTVPRIPTAAGERRPMCSTLAQCATVRHDLEQTTAALRDTGVASSRANHPSTRRGAS